MLDDSREVLSVFPSILSLLSQVECRLHSHLSVSSLAGDVSFLDLPPSFKHSSHTIHRECLLGRGAFGFVFRGSVRPMGAAHPIDVSQSSLPIVKWLFQVAVKTMQPYEPSAHCVSAMREYTVVCGRWEREGMEYSTRAYLSARHELR